MNELRGITVTGVGEASSQPDTLELRVTLSSLGSSIAEANERSGSAASRVFETLADSGVAEDDIRTAALSLGPEYAHDGNQRKLLGYRARYSIIVKIRDITASGGVIDDMVAAGGDDLVVDGLEFVIEDQSNLLMAAREAAWNDALNRATQFARLADRGLGPARSIREARQSPEPVARMSMEAARSPSQPIAPGTRTIIVTVDVTFDLS